MNFLCENWKERYYNLNAALKKNKFTILSNCKLIQLWKNRILILYENNKYITPYKKNATF